MHDAPTEAFSQRMRLIAQATNDQAAAALCQAFPGKRLYIPIEINEAHPISEIIGLKQARRLADRYGGFHVELPTGAAIRQYHRDREIVDAYRTGASVTELANTHTLSPRQIMRIIKANLHQEPTKQ